MNKTIICMVIALTLSGCNFPANLPLYEREKPADNFARHFFDNMIQGQTDSCFANLLPQSETNSMKGVVDDASKDLSGYTIKKYNIVENQARYTLSTRSGQTASYLLGYVFQLEKESKPRTIIFRTRIYENEGVFYLVNFSGENLTASIEESSRFSLAGKTVIHYGFLLCIILTVAFILLSLVVMLRIKMTTKKKVIWTLIILFITLPRFSIDWGTGETGLQLLSISLFGAGYFKSALYAPWVLYFSLPLGAIIFWFKRESLLGISNNEWEPKFSIRNHDNARDLKPPTDYTLSKPDEDGTGHIADQHRL